MLNSNIGKSYSSEKALDATDAVISELKNLARSMLEATNLARNKTRTFGRPCLENYLSDLEKNKEVNSSFPEKEEVKSLELGQEKTYELNCNAMKSNYKSFEHGHCASFITENSEQNESEISTKKEVYNNEPCLEKEKYTTNCSTSMGPNKVKSLERNLVNRVCRLPERKYKANSNNVNVNAISNPISKIDESNTNCIADNRAKTTEVRESANSLYIDKCNESSHAIINKESATKSNNTKEEIICEPQETSNLVNYVKNVEKPGVSTETNIPADEHLMYEQAKMVKWFGSINDGVCTFTFCDTIKKINNVNVHSERENYRVEWYNNILNSLWNAEPHTRFVDVKQISATKNISQIYVNTNNKQTELKESENKADENDVNFCANSWSANWCEDDDANCFSTRRKAQCIATKVFRVPTFPFGGGITWAQLEYLQGKFNEVLQNERSNLQSNECIDNAISEQECHGKICIEQNCTRSMTKKFPRLITLKAFSHRSSNGANKHACNDVTTTSTTISNNESDGYYSFNDHDKKNYIRNNYNNNDATNFNVLERFDPTSPYEFVAELERKIIFDAVSARRERLEMFRREVEEKKFPAIPDTFDLRIIMDPLRTGFQEDKAFPIIKGDIIADRYEVIELLGKATFSRTVRCYDLHKPIYAEEDESMEYDGDDNNNSSTDDQNENYDGSEISVKESLEREYCQLLESQRQSSSITSNVHANTVDETDKESGCEQKEQRIFPKNNEKSVAYAEKLVHHAHKKCKERKVHEPISYVEVCLKIINNSKDFFDQSLDEIRLLRFINAHKDADEAHVIRLFDAFYYKEHTMLVTELLSDNLYEYSKYNRENESEPYFTLEHLRSIARQITESLAYIHSLKLIHADLKPENILFVSHRQCIIKIIDFGSSCFLSDHLSSYIQSRSYRAPEVILGCDYDGRIDVWSLGAILVELVTGEVLFPSKTVPDMLARIVHVCGSPLPRSMLWEGRHTCSYFNKFGCIYEIDNSNRLLMQKEDEDAVFDGTKFEKVETNVTINGKGMESTKPPTIYLYTPVHEVHKKVETEQKLEHAKCRSIAQIETKEQNRRVETAFEISSLLANKSHSLLRQKLAAAGMKDALFISFVEACLHLDHKERSTSNELLTHPFISQHDELEEEHTTSLLFVPELKKSFENTKICENVD